MAEAGAPTQGERTNIALQTLRNAERTSDVPSVLIATDGSDFSIRSAQRALAVLPPDSHITVLTVAEAPLILPATPGFAVASVPDVEALEAARDANDTAAREALDATIAALGRDADPRLEHGEPGRRICEVAAEESFDAVVVGSHGSNFVKRALLGSVSHHVLHHAPCPVIVVRESDEE